MPCTLVRDVAHSVGIETLRSPHSSSTGPGRRNPRSIELSVWGPGSSRPQPNSGHEAWLFIAVPRTARLPSGGTNDLIVSDVIRGNELQVWFVAEHAVELPQKAREVARRSARLRDVVLCRQWCAGDCTVVAPIQAGRRA